MKNERIAILGGSQVITKSIISMMEEEYRGTEITDQEKEDIAKGNLEIYNEEDIVLFIRDLEKSLGDNDEENGMLIEKAKKDISKLQKKIITDSIGRRKTVWVKPIEIDKDHGHPSNKHAEASEIYKKKKRYMSKEDARKHIERYYGKDIADYVHGGGETGKSSGNKTGSGNKKVELEEVGLIGSSSEWDKAVKKGSGFLVLVPKGTAFMNIDKSKIGFSGSTSAQTIGKMAKSLIDKGHDPSGYIIYQVVDGHSDEGFAYTYEIDKDGKWGRGESVTKKDSNYDYRIKESKRLAEEKKKEDTLAKRKRTIKGLNVGDRASVMLKNGRKAVGSVESIIGDKVRIKEDDGRVHHDISIDDITVEESVINKRHNIPKSDIGKPAYQTIAFQVGDTFGIVMKSGEEMHVRRVTAYDVKTGHLVAKVTRGKGLPFMMTFDMSKVKTENINQLSTKPLKRKKSDNKDISVPGGKTTVNNREISKLRK